MTEITDPIVASVCRQLAERSAVGIAKYGVTVARTDLTLLDWMIHAQEETLDKAVYQARAIQDLRALFALTPELIDRCAQRLASWETGSVWPDSWDANQVWQMRRDAEKVLREAGFREMAAQPQ